MNAIFDDQLSDCRVWFSGLRGAVAYASANIFPDTTDHKSEIVATTTAVILYTIFVHGGLTIKMCDYLGIETGVDDQAVVAALPKVCTHGYIIRGLWSLI